jgi:hypothetical protein
MSEGYLSEHPMTPLGNRIVYLVEHAIAGTSWQRHPTAESDICRPDCTLLLFQLI